jgi:hypothetical protein
MHAYQEGTLAAALKGRFPVIILERRLRQVVVNDDLTLCCAEQRSPGQCGREEELTLFVFQSHGFALAGRCFDRGEIPEEITGVRYHE